MLDANKFKESFEDAQKHNSALGEKEERKEKTTEGQHKKPEAGAEVTEEETKEEKAE